MRDIAKITYLRKKLFTIYKIKYELTFIKFKTEIKSKTDRLIVSKIVIYFTLENCIVKKS